MEHAYYSQYGQDDVDNDEEVCQIDEGNDKTDDELLIDVIKGYPHLYDSFLKEFKDIRMRENSWKEISVFMNMPADNCQNRWLRLRERFTKEQRLQEIDTRSGSAASRRPVFPFYNNMMFLKKFIRRKKSYSNVTNSPIKKRAVDMSNVYTDEDSSTKDTSSHHSLDIGTDSSHLCSTSSNIVPEEVEITSRTNFSRNQRFQKI